VQRLTVLRGTIARIGGIALLAFLPVADLCLLPSFLQTFGTPDPGRDFHVVYSLIMVDIAIIAAAWVSYVCLMIFLAVTASVSGCRTDVAGSLRGHPLTSKLGMAVAFLIGVAFACLFVIKH